MSTGMEVGKKYKAKQGQVVECLYVMPSGNALVVRTDAGGSSFMRVGDEFIIFAPNQQFWEEHHEPVKKSLWGNIWGSGQVHGFYETTDLDYPRPNLTGRIRLDLEDGRPVHVELIPC